MYLTHNPNYLSINALYPADGLPYNLGLDYSVGSYCESVELPMTVAVGAICEDGKYVVVAADKMIIFPSPANLQFEAPDLCKIATLTTTAAVAFSGAISDGEIIVSKTKSSIASNPSLNISTLVETLRGIFVEESKNRFEQKILQPLLGANVERYQQIITQSAGLQIFLQISQTVMQMQNQWQALFVGVDNIGAHIFNIVGAGILQPTNILGFSAVGAGAPYAIASLAIQKYTKARSLAECLRSVYMAKRAAEVAVGVGQSVDMIVITDKIYSLTPEQINLIDNPSSSVKDIEELCKNNFQKK